MRIEKKLGGGGVRLSCVSLPGGGGYDCVSLHVWLTLEVELPFIITVLFPTVVSCCGREREETLLKAYTLTDASCVMQDI